MKKTNFLLHGAAVAALYVVLTAVSALAGLSSGVIQLRLSEALCVLPVFMPEAIWGLFAGCIISNTLTGAMLPDIIFGSIATLIGAVGTYLLRRKKYLPLIPPIAANTLIIPFVLKYAYGFSGSVFYFMATVAAGEILSCGVLGALLLKSIKKHNIF